MKEKIVTYQSDELNVTLVISEATVRMNLLRTLLLEESSPLPKEDATETDQVIPPLLGRQMDSILRVFLYPALISSVKSQMGFDHWPISYQEFCNLPDKLEVPWEEATFELNPHWQPDMEPSEQEKEELRKKAMELILELGLSSEIDQKSN